MAPGVATALGAPAWSASCGVTVRAGSRTGSRTGSRPLPTRSASAPATNLADSTVLEGQATWTGSLLGVDTGHAALPPVFGEAALHVDLAMLAGTAQFDNLTVDVDGVSRAFRNSSLAYAVNVADNRFSDEQGRIMGGFYGPEHEEMAGVLDDRVVNLLAGFGGAR